MTGCSVEHLPVNVPVKSVCVKHLELNAHTLWVNLDIELMFLQL